MDFIAISESTHFRLSKTIFKMNQDHIYRNSTTLLPK